jgi:hypothetical protein
MIFKGKRIGWGVEWGRGQGQVKGQWSRLGQRSKIKASSKVKGQGQGRVKGQGQVRSGQVGLSKVLFYMFKHFLTSSISEILSGIVSAVKFRKNENKSSGEKISSLKNDILNGPKHIFGCHDQCPSYFCNGPKTDEENLWIVFKNSEVFSDFNRHLTRVANNASSLHDVDTNMAECYNSVVNKLIGGKRVNFSKGGSYQNRTIAGVANFNNNRPFFYKVQKKLGNVGSFTEKFCLKNKRSKKKCLRKQKIIYQADSDYGIPTVEDLSVDEFEVIKNEFLINIENANCEEIEQNTRGQSVNPKWLQERMYRLTSSNFGKICKLRPTTSTASTVKNLIYNTNIKRSAPLQHGIVNEKQRLGNFLKVSTVYMLKNVGCSFTHNINFWLPLQMVLSIKMPFWK